MTQKLEESLKFLMFFLFFHLVSIYIYIFLLLLQTKPKNKKGKKKEKKKKRKKKPYPPSDQKTAGSSQNLDQFSDNPAAFVKPLVEENYANYMSVEKLGDCVIRAALQPFLEVCSFAVPHPKNE